MQHRLGRMSPAARKAAAVASSLGRRFTVTELAAVLDTPASTVLDPVRELISSELLTEGPQTLSFSHDLNREAVRASLPASAVQALDRQVASVLLAAGALPVEVAGQLASSAAPGDQIAITTLMKASDALRSTDPSQAADLARRALDLTPAQHPLRGPLVARIAVLLHAAGQADEAKAFADGALRQALPAGQEAEVCLSIAGLFSISPEVRAESCRRALALPGVPADLRARLLAQLFYNLMVAVRLPEAQQLLPDVRKAVEATGDTAARYTQKLTEAALLYLDGHFGTALAMIDASLSGGAGELPQGQLARHLRCRILAEEDRFGEALAEVTEGIRSAQQARQARAVQLFEANRARQLLQLGQLADAAAALEGRFSPEDAHLVVSVLDADAVVVLGRVALHTADQRQTGLTSAVARGMLGSGVPGVERTPPGCWPCRPWPPATRAARRWLTAAGEEERLSVFPLFPLDPATTRSCPHRVASGDTELAESATARPSGAGSCNPGAPAVAASAAHARGLLTGDAAALAEAAAILEAGQRRLAAASALEDLAVAEIRAGHAQPGRRRSRPRPGHPRRLRGALGPGPGPDAAAAARGPAPPGRRAASGPGLGRADQLRALRGPARRRRAAPTARWPSGSIISPHTVSGHLRHAFEKLSISSRVALSRLALEHQEP